MEQPLNPNMLAEMISRGLVTHLAGHDLAGYTASVDPDTKLLTLTHPTKPAITIPHAHLWRDVVMTPPSHSDTARDTSGAIGRNGSPVSPKPA